MTATDSPKKPASLPSHRSRTARVVRKTLTGFTLVELLVVIAIIGVLVALLLPAVQAAREASRRSHCANNLKQLGLAAQNYQSAQTRLPPQYGWTGDEETGSFGTLFFHILPFIEQGTLHAKARVSSDVPRSYPCSFTLKAGTIDSRADVGPNGANLGAQELPGYNCPSEQSQPYALANWGWGGSCYASNYQVFALDPLRSGVTDCCGKLNVQNWSGRAAVGRTVTDGSSNTLFFAEKFANCNSTGPLGSGGAIDGGNLWARWDHTDAWQPTFAAFLKGATSMFQSAPYPHENGGPCNPRLAQTPHADVMNVSLGDGSVRALSDSMSGDVWWALCTPAGDEVASAP